MADAYWQKDWYDVAIDLGERMIAIDHHRIDGYVQVARAALALDSLGKAHKALEAGLTEHPQSAILMMLMSTRYRRVGAMAAAEDLARRAMELQPNNPEIVGNLAVLLIETRRGKEGRELLDRVLEIDPDAGHTMAMAAHAAFAGRRFGEANALAMAALERDPHNEMCRQVIARSRVYGSPAMRPYWWLTCRSPYWTVPMAFAGLVAILEWRQSPVAMLGGAVLAYVLICWMVATFVDGGKADIRRQDKTVRLKDY